MMAKYVNYINLAYGGGHPAEEKAVPPEALAATLLPSSHSLFFS